jgi:hypothetical protein
MPKTYNPDLRRKLYTIEQIAGSYQCSHVSIWNMPCDEEFLYALSVNGHSANKLEELKAAYRRRTEVLA